MCTYNYKVLALIYNKLFVNTSETLIAYELLI